MTRRMHIPADAPLVYKAVLGLEESLDGCGLDKTLLDLVRMRASQINGCAYCLDMHAKELRANGETEQRRYTLDAWQECPYYTDRERAAAAWTEAVTLVTEGHVPDSVYEAVRPHFAPKAHGDTTLAIVAINGWNRLNVATRREAGSYRPRKK